MLMWVGTLPEKVVTELFIEPFHYCKGDFWLLWVVITSHAELFFFYSFAVILQLCRCVEAPLPHKGSESLSFTVVFDFFPPT